MSNLTSLEIQVLSKSNTFQKFYTNKELQDYIFSVTGFTPTKLSNGIFFIKLS